jgi:hypothetical protein
MRIDYEPESQKRPFLNQEESSAKLLIFRGANYPDSGPVFETHVALGSRIEIKRARR